jgi:alkaline phosphatase D
VRYFNSVENGFSTVELTQDACDWRAYSVNKNINSTTHGIRQIQHWRKEVTHHELVRVRESAT